MAVRSRLCCLATFALLASSSGCALVGIVADKVSGGAAKVDAQYDLGLTTQVLVIAENYRANSQDATDSDRLARLISDELSAKKTALIVSQEKLALVRDAKPDAFNKMSVVDVGKAVGAQKIIYVDVQSVGVGVQTGSDVLKGVAHANVKVIDVAAGEVVFPRDNSDGLPTSFETQMQTASDTITSDSMRTQTLIGLSSHISRLFYSYTPSDMEAIDPGS